MAQEVTKNNPCPICGKPDWCFIFPDGSVGCRRENQPGSIEKVDKNGETYWLYPTKRGNELSPSEADPPPFPSKTEVSPETMSSIYNDFLSMLSLSEAHKKDLLGRGLSEEEIKARRYRSVPGRERTSIVLDLEAKHGAIIYSVPGFYIKQGKSGRPFRSCAGGSGFFIPIRDQRGLITGLQIRLDKPGKAGKYIHFSSKKQGGPGARSTPHFPLFDGPRNIIRATEGLLKADITTVSSGIYTIGLAGVNGWRPAIKALMELRPERVKVAYDADFTNPKKPQVANNLLAFLTELQNQGFNFAMEKWDEKQGKGIDNLLAGGHTPEVIEAAQAVELVRGVVEKSKSLSCFVDGVFVCKLLADDIERQQPFKKIYGGLRHYKNGVYLPGGEEIFKKMAADILGNEYLPRRVDSALRYIIDSRLDGDPCLNPLIINVKNGRLDWTSKKLLPHDPTLPEIIQIPVTYDPAADCPTFKKYLITTFEKEIIPLVLEFLGLLLIPSTVFEVTIMLIGSGANGKSVLIRVIENLLGEENVSNIELQALAENRFALAGLAGKLVNVFADLSDRALGDSALFKALNSGDTVTGEHKYGKPFKFRNFARMVFSANRMPTSRDRTFAFYRRWIIIPFTRTFQKENADKQLGAKLAKEVNGIFNLALEGLARLVNNGAFTEPPQVGQALEAYKIQNDSILAFLSDCVKENKHSVISKQTLYDRYKEYCEDQGLRPFSQQKLRGKLFEAFPSISEGRAGARGPRLWRGIQIINEEGEALPDLYALNL